MKAETYTKIKHKFFIAVTALLLLTGFGFNAQAQQEAKPSYPGLSIQPSNNTPDAARTNRSRNKRPTEADQGYNGVMATPRAHTNRQNLRRFNQQQNQRNQPKSSYAYSSGKVGASGRATERQMVNNRPPEEEETAVAKPKPMTARFAASEQKMNLIKALREKRGQEKEKRRQEMEAKKKDTERRQQFRSSGSVALP
ncbi:MAG: hypothetical protein ACQEQL_03645 [Pseudomonadota bacterium]